jgi:hypothetical protein
MLQDYILNAVRPSHHTDICSSLTKTEHANKMITLILGSATAPSTEMQVGRGPPSAHSSRLQHWLKVKWKDHKRPGHTKSFLAWREGESWDNRLSVRWHREVSTKAVSLFRHGKYLAKFNCSIVQVLYRSTSSESSSVILRASVLVN